MGRLNVSGCCWPVRKERFVGKTVTWLASMRNVPTGELPRVLAEIHDTLKPGGVLFASNPRGDNDEGWNGDRYGVYHDLPSWQRYLTAAGFTEIGHYYRPAGLPREQQPWLASVWRRPSVGRVPVLV